MSELPQGWATATVGEIADVKLGKMLDKAKNNGTPTPYLRNINVRWGSFKLDDLLNVPLSDEEREIFEVRDGDLMVCEGGEPGRCAVWRHGPTDIKYQKALHRVRTELGFSPEYLASYLRMVAQNGSLTSNFTGTTIKHLPRTAFMRVSLPIPPLLEQRRIVAKLDRLSARSAAARDHLARTTKLATRAKQAILSAAFDPTLHDVVEPISRMAERVTKGASPKWQGFDYQANGILFVRSQNVGWGNLLLEEKAFLDEAFNAKQKNSVIMVNDVLLNIVGASIGRTAVATPAIEGANCNQAVAVIRLAEASQTDARFLNLWLQSDWAQNRITDGSVDVARANFSLASIKGLALPWPEQSEREEIVRRIEATFARIDRATEEANRAAHLLDRLDERLLAKAFRGELVPQDPEDEPAEALLARIREARAAAPKAKRGRRKKATAE